MGEAKTDETQERQRESSLHCSSMRMYAARAKAILMGGTFFSVSGLEFDVSGRSCDVLPAQDLAHVTGQTFADDEFLVVVKCD